MAFISSMIRRSVFGNMRIEIWSYETTSGTTSGNITTGVDSIEHVSLEQATVTASTTIDHTSTGGTVALGGLPTTDTGTVMVVGRT